MVSAGMTALPSVPLWFKRSGSLLPANLANESDIVVVIGKLILAVFNRPPLTQQVIFYDISNPANPVQLAAQPWAGAMGSMLVDSAGVLHIFGSSPPATNDNALIHSTVDPNTWAISAPNTIFQLPNGSGQSFNNIGAGLLPDGSYLLSIEQAFSGGGKAETYFRSTGPTFATYTDQGSLYLSQQDFTGRTCIRQGSDGWTYLTSDTSTGYCRIARTKDGIPANFRFATNPYGFLGPGADDTFPGKVGGNPFYDGNVSWAPWNYQGQPVIYSVYFESNETDDGELMIGAYLGTLASLVSQFAF